MPCPYGAGFGVFRSFTYSIQSLAPLWSPRCDGGTIGGLGCLQGYVFCVGAR